VLDFYCPERRLAIELDGSVHDSAVAAEYDAARTAVLEERGIHVLRVPNGAVLTDLDAVLRAISHAASARTPRERRAARD
jgi:very-short-patch-repair endonuclease